MFVYTESSPCENCSKKEICESKQIACPIFFSFVLGYQAVTSKKLKRKMLANLAKSLNLKSLRRRPTKNIYNQIYNSKEPVSNCPSCNRKTVKLVCSHKCKLNYNKMLSLQESLSFSLHNLSDSYYQYEYTHDFANVA